MRTGQHNEDRNSGGQRGQPCQYVAPSGQRDQAGGLHQRDRECCAVGPDTNNYQTGQQNQLIVLYCR